MEIKFLSVGKKNWTRLACYPSNLRNILLVAVNAFLIRTDIFIFYLFIKKGVGVEVGHYYNAIKYE